MLLKDSIASSRSTLAFAESITAFVEAALPFLFVRCLLRHPLRFYQSVPTLGGDGRQLRVGSSSSQVALAWANCWSRSGVSIDASIPHLDVSPNIRLPALEVAADRA